MATIVAIGLFTLTATATTNVHASSDDCRDKPFPQDIACAVGGVANGYDSGYSDGKSAGVRGESSSCPSSDTAYCTGWNGGYNDGADARSDVETERNSDDGEFEESDD